jgi:hypothetical protein
MNGEPRDYIGLGEASARVVQAIFELVAEMAMEVGWPSAAYVADLQAAEAEANAAAWRATTAGSVAHNGVSDGHRLDG